jgi:excisionase family DNA binding protein
MTVRKLPPAPAANDPGPSEPRLAFGAQEVADALGVSHQLVKHMIRTGQLPSVKRGRRRLINRKAIGRFLHRMRTGPRHRSRRNQGCRPPGAKRASHDR